MNLLLAVIVPQRVKVTFTLWLALICLLKTESKVRVFALLMGG